MSLRRGPASIPRGHWRVTCPQKCQLARANSAEVSADAATGSTLNRERRDAGVRGRSGLKTPTLARFGDAGARIGRNLWVAGLFARLLYLSLYKMHERALHGVPKVTLDALARWITGRTEPHVKLY